MRHFPALRLAFLVTSLVAASCTTQPISLVDGDGGSDTSGNGASGPGSGGAGGAGSGASGGSGGSGGASVQPASFVITAGVADLELRDTADVNVSIAPNGYVGNVALSIGLTPADVQASLASPTVTLDGSTTATVTLTVSTLPSTQTGAFVVSVVGTVEAGEKSGDAVVNIAPVITITIPQNLASFSANPANTTAFGDFPTIIKALPNMSSNNPITVKFFNADTVDHEIHADDPDSGFPHGNQSIPPNSFDPVVRMINTPGEFLYYPHDIGQSILGQINIE